tara:strand:+ start:52311 stop:52787 length:477 start_codon:yes stop_codon:yes gene_type:complete
MKTIHDWFDEYGQSHQNKTNKIIHWICIPLIFWSIIALLSIIPQQFIKIGSEYNFLHFGTIVIILGLFFYLRLSFKIFLGMFVFSLYVLLDVYFWDTVFGRDVLMFLAISIFVFSWILQFYGHKIEGKKPSFAKDIQFLLIGPAWLLGYIYKKIGIKF